MVGNVRFYFRGTFARLSPHFRGFSFGFLIFREVLRENRCDIFAKNKQTESLINYAPAGFAVQWAFVNRLSERKEFADFSRDIVGLYK